MSIRRLSVIAGALLLTCASAGVPAAVRARTDRSSRPAAPAAGAAYEPSGPCRSGTAGDFDGDGVRDVAVGAPYATAGGRRRAGAVAVRYAGRTAWLTARPATLDAGFGAALATGDFDGDHCADLAVAAPDEGMARPGADGTGRVYVYLGSPAGLRRHVTLSVRDLGRRPGGDLFGTALAAADLDHDGRDDLVVGSPGLPDGGGIGVFTHGLRDARLITQRTSWVGQRTSATDDFGTALATGRFGGGRHVQIAVGAPGDGKDSSGAVTVLDPAARSSRRITEDSPGVPGVPEREDDFGAALAAGDFDRDGTDDLAVGIPGEDDTSIAENASDGAVQVFYGSGGHQVLTLRRGGRFGRFGSALAAADLGGDGAADLAAGAPGTGFVRILTGHLGRGLSGDDVLRSPAGRTAQFGWTLAARGRDLYVGAPGAGGFGGTVLRVRGGRSTTVQTGAAGELLGYAIT